MRAYLLALFFLCLQLAGAAVNSTQVFDNNPIVDYSTLEKFNTTVKNSTFGGSEPGDLPKDYTRAGYRDAFDIIYSLFNVKQTLRGFGIPESVTYILSYPIYFIWIIAIAQLFLRISFTDKS